jgi:VWFA-related protein
MPLPLQQFRRRREKPPLDRQRACRVLGIKRPFHFTSTEKLALLLKQFRIMLFIGVALLPATAIAQKPSSTPAPKTEEQQEPVKIFTEEVRLPVIALDQFGHYDPTLELDDVLVLEDGVAQQIRSIQRLPVNILLLLDVGNDLGLKNTNVTRDVALRVLALVHTGNRFAVMQFAARPELLQTWTDDKERLVKILKTKLQSGKTSRLSDAIAAAADQFKDTPPGTRHIVLITDGVESPGGRTTLINAMKQLNSVQATVHIISYTVLAREQLENRNRVINKGDGAQRDGNPGSNPVANGDPTLPPGTTRTPTFRVGSIDLDVAMRRKRKEYERATQESEARLKDIADESGGQILLPKSNDELASDAEAVARDIGSQYVVTYRPKRPLAEARPGEYRRVEVASRRVGLYLRSRRGYLVPMMP